MAIFRKIEPMCLDGLCYFERHHFYENRGKKGQGGNIERQVELNENENLTAYLHHTYLNYVQDNLSYPSTFKLIKKLRLLQLNEHETDPYFLQNFRNKMIVCLIIHVFRKSCELEIVQKKSKQKTTLRE